MLKRLLESERGSTLVLVLVFTAVLLLLGGALMTYAMSDKTIADRQEDETRLYYIAEAGIEAGVAALRQNYSFHSTIDSNIDGGSYRVNVIIPPSVDYPELSTGQRMIISRGLLEGRELTLRVIAALDDLYSKTLMVSDKLDLESVQINGNLHYNTSLWIRPPGTTVVTGILSYPIEDGIQEPGGNGTLVIEGETVHQSHIQVPPIDFESFLQDQDEFYIIEGNETLETAPAGVNKILVRNGDLTIAPKKDQTFDFNGVIIVEGTGNTGNVYINPQQHSHTYLNGTIVAEGKIQMQPGADINPGEVERKVIFVSNTEIHIHSDYDILFGGSVLLFSKGDITISGPTNPRLHIFGTIIAEGTLYLSNCELTYDPDVFQESDFIPGLQVVIQEWLKP